MAIEADSVVDVHVGREVGAVSEGLGHVLELAQKGPRDDVRGDGPEVVLDAVVRGGERPRHSDLHGPVGLELGDDLVGVGLEHEEGGDGDVSAAAVVGHGGLRGFARFLLARVDARPVGAEARVVGDNHAGGARALRVADLLDKGTRAAVHHENVRRQPRIAGLLAPGIAPTRVHIGVAQVGIGVVHHLRNRTAVRRNSKQSHAVIIVYQIPPKWYFW